MRSSPKDTEEKIHKMINTWETLAPDKHFGGMSLAQFKEVAGRSLAARERLDDLEDQRREILVERAEADEDFNIKAQQVVAGVLADPEEGPDSALYQGFGYTTRRERKSGLTRKSKQSAK